VGSSHDACLAEERIPTADGRTTLAAIARFFAPYGEQLAALGIASFGPLELDRASPSWGSMLATPKPGWGGAPVAPELARVLGVPVRIDTDVNAAALAEQRWGSGAGADPCVYITVGTGVGVGVVTNGAPLHGLMHPELGHLRAPDLCDFAGACPFHGRCIEGVASAHALRVRTGRDPRELSDRDPVWTLEARYLGHLVAACVLAYAPRRIVLGGGVLERMGLLEGVRVAVAAELAGYVPRGELSQEGLTGYLVAPGLGGRAGLAGAFLLAQEESGP
jgi:fructokinase